MDSRRFSEARLLNALWLVRPLLWMNRWLLLLLMLWPYGMAVILLVGSPHPAFDDVLSVFKQECMYGMALVAFNGGALLSNELRSRRIIMVLAKSVSRPGYLLALLGAAWVALALYVVGFGASGILLARLSGLPASIVWKLTVLQLVGGLWIANLSICFSVFLPAFFASLSSAGICSMLAYFQISGPGKLIAGILQMPLTKISPADVLFTFAASAAVFTVACLAFKHRDLDLSLD